MSDALDAVRAGETVLVRLRPAADEAAEGDLALLDADERARADAQRDPTARARFAATRALLRNTLSELFGGAPRDWRFERDARRRPRLAPGARAPDDVVFSLAHCRAEIGCAVALGGRVGLDLEDASSAADVAAAATQVLHPAERAAVAGFEGAARDAALLAFWTCKEAYLKACGAGFLADPRAVMVDLGVEPARLRLPSRGAEGADWTLRRWRGRAVGALADDRGRPSAPDPPGDPGAGATRLGEWRGSG